LNLKNREEHSMIRQCELHIREGVWVFKQKPYVHTWIDLREHPCAQQPPTG
jgi:hypothetical protein